MWHEKNGVNMYMMLTIKLRQHPKNVAEGMSMVKHARSEEYIKVMFIRKLHASN
jgi:hypothetical protein